MTITLADLQWGLSLQSLFDKVPVLMQGQMINHLQMSEADRVDKYNDIKALVKMLEGDQTEDVLQFLAREKERLFLTEILRSVEV